MDAMNQQPVQRPRRIFISYRRSGGIEIARGLYEQLRAWGYDVFIDLEGLRAGAFNQSLYQQIKNSDVFLLVLTKGCLDRCRNKGDWVRQELSYAILCGLNIVPVMHEDFVFPHRLPQDISALPSYQGLRISYEFYDAFLGKLVEYINTEQVRFFPQEMPQPARTQNLGAVILGAAALIAAALLIAAMLSNRDTPAKIPETTGQTQDTTASSNTTGSTQALETTEATQAAETTEATQATESTQAEEAETLFGNTLTNLANNAFVIAKNTGTTFSSSQSVAWFNCLNGEQPVAYWYDSANHQICADGLDGKADCLLENVQCEYLYVTDQWLYCALLKDDITTLYRAKNDVENRTIGTLEPLVEGLMAKTNRIAIRDGYIYYWVYKQGLFRCRTDGTEKQLLYSENEDCTYEGWKTFHVSGAKVYFIATRGVWSVPVSGGHAKRVIYFDQEERDVLLTHAVVYNEQFYYVVVPRVDGRPSGVTEIWCSETSGENLHVLCTMENEQQEVQLFNLLYNTLYLRVKDGTDSFVYKIYLKNTEIKPEFVYNYSQS